jgi:hypothetical protein
MPTNTAEAKHKTNHFGAAVRAIVPAIPLGIALVHGAMAPKHPTNLQGQINPMGSPPTLQGCAISVPCPMVAKGHPAMWWFVFKLNARSFPGCGGGTRSCPFGGEVQTGPTYSKFGQQYLVASSDSMSLHDGLTDCLGTKTDDPVGASFDEVYNGKYHYLIWNDQPYGDPQITSCTSNGNCASPWGHSKGIVAWNDEGEGFVMQVSTPSWPEAGRPSFPRRNDGNTLGCVRDNNVTFSQHLFALRLSKNDLVLVLQGLANASVVTDPKNQQIVNNGGPSDVQTLVNSLGKRSDSDSLVEGTLSTGVLFLSKPSNMNVPPWQMVSAQLGGVSLRTATFWANPKIPTTMDSAVPDCWDESLGTPGPVAIATSGSWRNTLFDLTGAPGANHAKIGVSTSGATSYSIFGDENQQGTLSGKCKSSQNGRGGTFYVMSNPELASSIRELINGSTAPTDTGKSPGNENDTTE